MQQPSWHQHYDSVTKKALAPAATLAFALQQFSKEQPAPAQKKAIDLGSGNGIDSIALLQDGWSVTAVDKEQAALAHLQQVLTPGDAAMLTLQHRSFEEAILTPSLLINATFSLPFCMPHCFPLLWESIRAAIQPGGRFAGQLFGPGDTWSVRKDMTFHTPAQVQKLFAGFSIEKLEETNGPGKTIGGAIKHWHVYHIVAQQQ